MAFRARKVFGTFEKRGPDLRRMVTQKKKKLRFIAHNLSIVGRGRERVRDFLIGHLSYN